MGILISVGVYIEVQSLLFSWDEEMKRKEQTEGTEKHIKKFPECTSRELCSAGTNPRCL